MVNFVKEKSYVIIAPHPDDEIIGCFEILNDLNKSITIIYNSSTCSIRRHEALKLKNIFPNIVNQIFHTSIPSIYLSPNTILYCPDPVNEVHPDHRRWGFVGEELARTGHEVIFYSTLMNVPYIHECNDPLKKETALNRTYNSQKSLWEYEKKYILFEGRCQWIF